MLSAGSPARAQPRCNASDREVRVNRLRAATQNRGVASLGAKRRGVAGHIRARFVDDANDADRHADFGNAETVWPRPFGDDLSHRVLERGDLPDAVGHRFDAFPIERQPVDHSAGKLIAFCFRDVLGVGHEQLLGVAGKLVGHRAERAAFLRGAQPGEPPRRIFRAPAKIENLFFDLHASIFHAVSPFAQENACRPARREGPLQFLRRACRWRSRSQCRHSPRA